IDEPGYDIYIKMEYLVNLNNYLRQYPLTLGDALRLGIDICTALSVLQKRNLIHRDIKPENIFINRDGNFKLGDFGIVRSLDESVSRMSARGTPPFMAPELARHEKIDYRIDLYSLGLVLYRLLNGNRAPFLPPLPTSVTHFEYNTAQDLRMKGEQLPPPAYADVKLSAIILKACMFDVNQRFRDAEQMKERLIEYDHSLNHKEKQAVILDITTKTKEPGLPEPYSSNLLNDANIGVMGIMADFNEDEYNFTTKLATPLSMRQKISMHMNKFIPAVAAIIALVVLIIYAIVNKPIKSEPLQDTSETTPIIEPIEAPMPVIFCDLAIESTVRQQLQKQTESIYTQDLTNITELRVDSKVVKSLEDLFSLPELKILDLHNQKLSDTSVLGLLTNLEELDVSGCGLTDASFLESLSALIRLDINHNDLTDICFIKHMKHLHYLNISDNTIIDLTPLSDLTELENLIADNNPIEDWSVVAHIAAVTGLPEPPEQEPTPVKKDIPANTPPLSKVTETEPVLTTEPEAIPPPLTTIAVTEVKLNRTSLLLDIGSGYKLSATVSPIDASEKSLQWSSSNPAIVEVDSSGNVLAVGPGTATITVKCGGEKASCIITVS
ncbi:MAG: protein kinase, partial [Firmicutes bacterium]|nr:protein kinase [Bacillota bacterium]